MSREVIVAKRYAKALYEVADAKGKTANVADDLRSVSEVLKGVPDFKKLLEHPQIDASVKIDLLKQSFAGKIADEALNLLMLLVDRKRAELIEDVQQQYDKLASEALRRAVAVVYTPKPLNDSERARIAEQFGKMTGKTIEIDNVIDPSLLGGLKVLIGDKLYDGSLSGKLKKLENSLISSQAL